MESLRVLIIFAVIFVLGNSAEASKECHENEEGCKHVVRKRRAVVEGSCLDGGKSPQRARDELNGYKGNFAVNSYNDTTMAKKRKFLTAAKSLIPAVCKNLTVGAAPAQAVSTLAGLHVHRKTCNETDRTLSTVPCEGCSQIAKYRITDNLLEKNTQWNCSQDNDTCGGVCIGSLRMPKDLISNYSTGCRSHVVHVQMFNPKTAQPVTVNSLGNAMSVEIEFDEDRYKTNSSDYKCYMWQHDAGRWDGSLCSLIILPRSSGNSQPYVAQCNCTRLGSVCVAFTTTDMNNPLSSSPTTAVPSGSNSTTASSGGGSGSDGATTASSGGSSGGGGSTTASSGGSSGSDVSTTASSGGSSGGGGSTTASSGGSSGGGASTTASSGGSSGGGGSTTASSGGSSGGGASTTASSGGSSGSDGLTTASSGGSSGGGASTTASSGGSSGGGGSTTASSGGSSGGEGSTSGSGGSGHSSGTIYNSLKFGGDCNTVMGTSKEQPFRDAATTKIQEAFHIRRDQIFNLEITCGSIIVSFYINQLDSSFLQHNITNIGRITTSNFTVALPDGTSFTVFQADVGYAPGNISIFMPPKPTIPPTTARRYEIVFDYTPAMAAVALGIACIVLCVCCTCIIHSWYLRKDKFTEYNSMTIKEYEEKMRAKEQKGMKNSDIPMTDMATPTAPPTNTTNFDMTNEEMPQVNERCLSNYDWAHTSYLPGMLARPTETEMEGAPRLILDEDSDSDEDEGQDNEGFEKSTLNIPHSVSHLSLDKSDLDESNDALSQKNYESPPLYDNVTDGPEDSRDPEQQDIYDNVDNSSNGQPPSPPQTEPEYSTIE